MRYRLAVLLGLGLLSASVFSAPLRAAQPITLQARTAGDLAALCAADPTAAASDAKINFCIGFAQGAVDTRMHLATDKKPFCPTPGTKRVDTMKEFVTWVRATPANRDLPVLDGLFKFFESRFPCK